jgi:hypothetical protein
MGYYPLQLHEMGAAEQLALPLIEKVELEFKLSLVIESELSKEVLSVVINAAQEDNVVLIPPLQDLIVSEELGVL